MSQSLWTPQVRAELVRLWYMSPPMSTAQIAGVLRLSKNAVCGQAHRMGLANRPSPIKQTEREGAPRARKAAPVMQAPVAPCAPTVQAEAAQAGRAPVSRPGSALQAQPSPAGPARQDRPILPVPSRAIPGVAPGLQRHIRREATLSAYSPQRAPEGGRRPVGPIAPPRTCQFPVSEHYVRTHVLCGAVPVADGKPYCAAHCAIAYIPVATRNSVDRSIAKAVAPHMQAPAPSRGAGLKHDLQEGR